MKKQNTTSLIKISGTVLIITIFFSCSTVNRIYTDNDLTRSTKRFELKYLVRDRVRRSPLHFFRQTVIKEINRENEASYTAYDVLTLSGTSFTVDDKVFLIIDNVPFSMKIDRMEFENKRSLSEDTQTFFNSESVPITVMTGYSENNSKIARFSYKIPPEAIERIRNSNQLLIRYYSGPSMMTVKPGKKSIRKLKQLIDTV